MNFVSSCGSLEAKARVGCKYSTALYGTCNASSAIEFAAQKRDHEGISIERPGCRLHCSTVLLLYHSDTALHVVSISRNTRCSTHCGAAAPSWFEKSRELLEELSFHLRICLVFNLKTLSGDSLIPLIIIITVLDRSSDWADDKRKLMNIYSSSFSPRIGNLHAARRNVARRLVTYSSPQPPSAVALGRNPRILHGGGSTCCHRITDVQGKEHSVSIQPPVSGLPSPVA